jgi:subtilase family serine protease
MFKSIFVRLAATCACVLLLTAGLAAAPAQVQDRIKNRIDPAVISEVKGNVHPQATRQRDIGRLNASFKIAHVTMTFKMTDVQRAALNDLLQRQQDPSSPDYHRWLTPEEYASRFGISENDRGKVVSWLQSQGLVVNEIGRNGRSVTFTGSARQIETAFRTSMHQYSVNGEAHYANATEPSVPSAFADLVSGFRGLNNFRLKARPNQRAVMDAPQFTSSVTGNHFLSPSDFATIYDLNPLYASGIDGRGQSIVIAGQTDVDLNDIRAFRTASGLPANDPVVVLVPGSADPGISKGDLPEADLDLEWAGAVAPNARLIYVNSTNVLDSLQYAIDQNLAPVASISYGDCEQNFTAQDVNVLLSITQQANSQGMTVLAASGDSGAADCDGSTATVARLGLAVDLPASLPSVTGLGGSEFREVTTASWSNTNTSSFGSALAYIPEGAWNDSSTGGGLASGGGGRSIYFSKPNWQSFSGVPNDAARDVPDVSLNASGDHDGYLMCSGGSCTNGFRSANGSLFVVGGTSASAPAFAAIVSLINQKTNSPQGNINPVLYSLAATAPSAFHDIIAGGNQVPCAPGSAGCGTGGVIGYSAGPGYDQATGLGSVDALNLVTAWPMPQTAPIPPAGGDPASPGTTPSSTPTSGPGSSPTSTPTSAPQPISVVEQGNVRSGYVLVTPDTNTAAPVPTLTFGTVSGGNVQSQTGITPIPMITDGSLFVDVIPGIGRNVGVAIVNPGTAANVVTLTLRDQNGIASGSPVTLTLSAHQQIARFVTELFPAGVIGTGFAGSLRLQSSSGFGVLGLRFSSSEFSTSPVGVTATSSDTTQMIALPQFAMGGGWATQLALVNNSSSTASGRVDVYDTSGNPMPVDLNNSTQSTFTYSIPAGGSLLLAPRDSNGQSPF